MNGWRATSLSTLCYLLLLVGPQRVDAQINVTTAHQDIPSNICSGTGCVYRTGQNLAENTLVFSTIADTNFGVRHRSLRRSH